MKRPGSEQSSTCPQSVLSRQRPGSRVGVAVAVTGVVGFTAGVRDESDVDEPHPAKRAMKSQPGTEGLTVGLPSIGRPSVVSSPNHNSTGLRNARNAACFAA